MTLKAHRLVFHMFIALLFFDFLTKDIFTNYFLSADGIKVQLYKVYILFIYLICVADFFINRKFSRLLPSLYSNIMILWLVVGVVNALLLPFISVGRIINLAYVPGDFVGWTIVPLLYFLFSNIKNSEREILLFEFMSFMRLLLIFGMVKFVLLKIIGVRIIPMGFPIYYLYLVFIYSYIIGFQRESVSVFFSSIEKKYTLFLFLLVIMLMVIYAQRTQLIVVIFIVAFMTLIFGRWNVKKMLLIFLLPLLIYFSLPYLPETIMFKFEKLMTGSGTILPNGIEIPFLVLDNSLTQRVYEATDAIYDLVQGGWGNVLFGFGNGASFKSLLMLSFKSEEFIHQIHISYIAVMFRMGVVGLSLLLIVFIFNFFTTFRRDFLSLISIAILCVAVDIFFFQKIYYSFELPFYLSLLASFGTRYNEK